MSQIVTGIRSTATEENREHARQYREDLNRIMTDERDDFSYAQARGDDERRDLRRELALDGSE